MEIEQLSDELIQYGFEQQMQDLYFLPQKENYHCFFRRGPFYESPMINGLSATIASQLINRFKYLG